MKSCPAFSSVALESEEEALRALGREIASAMRSPWEPTCVAYAFSRPKPYSPVFTMQTWIELSAIQSPLIIGRDCDSLEAYAATADVFGLSINGLEAEEVADVITALRRAIEDGFAMALSMRPEDAAGASSNNEDGFGTWLPIWASLIAQCHLSVAEARSMPVGQAYALMAAVRRNQGWLASGQPYALRDLEELPADISASTQPSSPALAPDTSAHA